MGKASTKAQNRYIAKSYDRIQIVVPKGRKADIESYVEAHGQSINGLVNDLLRQALCMTEDKWREVSVFSGATDKTEKLLTEDIHE